jgi:hypothetical protein
MPHFLGLVFLVLWVTSALSQPAPSGFPVTGIIQDPTNAAVPAAKVALKRADRSQEQSSSADATGTFRFERVLPGNYEIRYNTKASSSLLHA